MKKTALFLLLSIFYFKMLTAQNCIIKYEESNFNLPNTENEIIQLRIDGQNNKWFSLKTSYNTYTGLGKYSTTDTVLFTSGNSDLPDNHVYDIAYDQNSNIWVATASGLAVFDGTTTTGWTIYNTSNSDIPSNSVTAIAIKGDNKWFGFSTGNVAMFNGTTWTVFDDSFNGSINAIAIDGDDNVWIAINGTPGLGMYNQTVWATFSETQYLTSIDIDSKGTPWFSYSEGICKYENNVLKFYGLSDTTSVFRLAIDDNDDKWISTTNGLFQFFDSTYIHYHSLNSAIPEHFKKPIAVDSDNNIWFSYYTVNNFVYAATGYFEKTQSLGVNIIADNGLNICNGDSTVLDAGSSFASFYWSTGETTQTIETDTNGIYNVAVSNDGVCFDYDTATVFVQKPFENEKLCMVTVSNDNNLLVWGKTPGVGTASFNIYKETSITDSMILIGNVPYENTSLFIDENSEVHSHAEKYAISVVDSCGAESELSPVHKTMFLTINKAVPTGINLDWTPYEGFEQIESYVILKGRKPDNLTEVATISGDNTLWHDDENGFHYYQISVVKTPDCWATEINDDKTSEGPYTHTVSNMEDNSAYVEANVAPTNIFITDSVIFENSNENLLIGILSSEDANSYDLHSYKLVEGEGSSNNSYFYIVADSLLTNTSFNYEITDTLFIRIQTQDDGTDTLTFEKQMKIYVQNVNENPTGLALGNAQLNENAPFGTIVDTLQTTDPDFGDTFSYNLVTGEGDTHNNDFLIDGDVVYSKTSFNYEDTGTISIRIKTTDAGGLSFEQALTITINDKNDAPTDIFISDTTIDNGVEPGTFVATLTAIDEDVSDSFTYSFVSGSNNNNLFVISNDSVYTGPETEIDYYTADFYIVNIMAEDSGNLTFTKTFTFTVNDPGNLSPTDIELSSVAINENNLINQFVGMLTASDPNPDEHTFSLVDGLGSNNNSNFNISNDSLFATVLFNYEETSTQSIRIRTTDNGIGNLYFEKIFEIYVNDINETPTDISLNNTTIDEWNQTNTLIGDFATEDEDANDIHSYSIVSNNGSENNFLIQETSLLAALSFIYEYGDSYSITIRSTDSGDLYFEKDFVITIANTGINKPGKVNEPVIFPNPFNNSATVVINNSNNTAYDLRIYNLSGQIVKQLNSITNNRI
ncbi:MAG: T9SS type A sorting domain-containing protein, partial [Chlorobi bacterium]|nr:T9SS type A sorting domain-containing protein [Chlorobiota bacterium]